MASAQAPALELPTFKGRPGWEFTDISGLDLAAYERVVPTASPAPARRPGEPLWELPESGELPEGVIVGTLDDARAPGADRAPPGLAGVGRRRRVRGAERRRRARRRVRVRARGCGLGGADLADERAGPHRDAAQPADAGGARGGRAGRGLGAVPVRSRRRRRRLQHRHRAGRRPQRAAALRLRSGAVGEELDLRCPARRGRPRRVARLGRARVRLGPRARADGDAARRRGRGGPRHRRLRHPRPSAHRLRHHPGARGAEHDLGPRVPRSARRAARPRSGRATSSSTRARRRPTRSRSRATC